MDQLSLTEYSCQWHYKDSVELIGVILLVIVYPGIEYWFGKTTKTRAGSLLEFLVFLVKPLLGFKRKPQLLIEGHVEGQGDSMLEGKELEGKIGTIGSYSLDIDDKLMLKADVSVNVDIYAEIMKAAEKSKSSVLVTVVEFVGKFLGRETAGAEQAEPTKTDGGQA